MLVVVVWRTSGEYLLFMLFDLRFSQYTYSVLAAEVHCCSLAGVTNYVYKVLFNKVQWTTYYGVNIDN